jgi:hypothetical protein
LKIRRWVVLALGLIATGRNARAAGPAVAAAAAGGAGGSGAGALAAQGLISGLASGALSGSDSSSSSGSGAKAGGKGAVDPAKAAEAARKLSDASRAAMMTANQDAKTLKDLWAPPRGNNSPKEMADEAKNTWEFLGDLGSKTREPLEAGKPGDLDKRLQRMQGLNGESSQAAEPPTPRPDSEKRDPHRASERLRRRSQAPPILLPNQTSNPDDPNQPQGL